MKKFLQTIIYFLFPVFIFGQDVHYSQFFAAPLFYNPAATGNFSGFWRFGLNYRDQWGSVTIPYKTYDLFTDVVIQPQKAHNRFALGLLALNDVAGDGQLSVTRAQLSAAYHINYTEDANMRFAFGMSGAWVQKKIDYTKLIFDNQWNGYGFDNTLPANENNISDNLYYTDFNVGAIITLLPYAGEKYFLSVAASHVTQPNESFYNDNNTIGMRETISAGGLIPINGNFSLQPQVYFSTQKKAYEIIGGSNIIIPLKNYKEKSSSAVFGGLWYRYNDAAWLLAGLTLGQLSFSASYDFNFSALTPASGKLGGLELAVAYILNKHQKRNPLNCPAYE